MIRELKKALSEFYRLDTPLYGCEVLYAKCHVEDLDLRIVQQFVFHVTFRQPT